MANAEVLRPALKLLRLCACAPTTNPCTVIHTVELSADGLQMPGGINSGLPIARLLMVVSSLAPLFLLWAIRGAPPISDRYWVTGCLALAVVPNLALLWRWRVARRSNDHRVIVVASARDQSDHLLVYLFAMLLPLYSVRRLLSKLAPSDLYGEKE
jgi:hypothetical protein